MASATSCKAVFRNNYKRPTKNVKIWDDWAQSRLNDYLDDLIVTANQHGLPTIPIRKTLMGCRHHAEKIIQTQTELACRQALIHPGNALQRTLLKTAHICEIILPFMAMSIVGFQVFQGFYDSSISNEAFLGVNFAIHSGLLILLSWLLPFFIRKNAAVIGKSSQQRFIQRLK